MKLSSATSLFGCPYMLIALLMGCAELPDGTSLTPQSNSDPEQSLPLLQFSSSSSTVDEGDGSVDVTVELEEALAEGVTVNYGASIASTAFGSGVDFTLASGTLTFAPGETSKNISVSLVDDSLDETSEIALIQLSVNSSNVELSGNTSHALTITDNDPQPSVQFSSSSSSGSESSTTTNLSVALSTVSGRNVTVNYAVSGGSASGSGVDYTLASGTLTLNAGSTSGSVAVTVVDDLLVETNETIQVTLSSPSGASLGTNTVHTYTITDNDAPPTVEFSTSSSQGLENVSPVNMAVALSSAAGMTVTVDYAITGGSASGSGLDYTLANGTLTFTAGQTSQDITASIVNDLLLEANETFIITLSNPVNATLGTTLTHTYTILDNDNQVEFAFSSSNAMESSSPAQLAVNLAVAAGTTTTVDYAVSGGSASGGGTDYTLASGTLTFNTGESSKTIDIVIINDTLDENDETIEVTLSNPVATQLGSNTIHTFTINDDDLAPTVQFDAASSSGSEGANPANFDVSLSNASGKTITVDYFSVGGTATGSGTDYTLTAGTLTFNAGETSKSISASIVDDAIDEGNETLIVDINTPTNATIGANDTHTYTILDNDQQVAFTIAASNAAENSSPALINVSLSSSSSQTITVDYSVTGGSASGASTDYSLLAGTLTFNAGETSKDISISIVDDALDEDNETIVITLANPSNANLGSTSVFTYTINDNDLPPALDFTLAASNNMESVTSANLAVQLSTLSGKNVTVDYAVSGGTAVGGGTDYTLASGTLTFTAGQNSQNISLSIVEDLLSEGAETVQVQLSNPSNATLGTQTSHTYTIDDNDPSPVVSFASASSNGDESATPALISVVLDAASGQTTSIDYAVSGGTATGGGTDFTLAAGTLTFNAGETSKNISIAAIDDSLDENNETIQITLSNPTLLNLGATFVHTYTINDNDAAPTVAFDLTSSSGQENASPVNLSVSLSGPSSFSITVNYSVTGGTATGSGTDYTLAAGMLTFSVGTTNQNISIAVVDDALVESDETVEVTLSTPSNATLGTNTLHTYTIIDNDSVGCPAGWWDCNWTRRVKITFDNSGQGQLSDFPVRVALNESKIASFYSEAKANGDDLRFVDADGSTLLDFEIERWNSSGTSEIWVEVPVIDSASTTDHIFLYYNNTAATNAQNASATWNSDFALVQHLKETSGTHADSTANANTGTNNGSIQNSVGQIGIANDFDGIDDSVTAADSTSLDNTNATLSAWVYLDSTSGDQVIASKGTNYRLGLRGSEVWAYFDNAGTREQVTSGALLSVGNWYYLSANFVKTGGSGSTEIFINGVSQGTQAHAKFPKADNNVFSIGNYGAAGAFNGIIDEVRVSSAIRNTDWNRAEYLNGEDSFSSIGSVETP